MYARPGKINDILSKSPKLENEAINSLDRQKGSFQERIKASEEKAQEIIKNATIYKIAKDLLERYGTAEEIISQGEDFLSRECGAYDPAVVASVCELIEKKENAKTE